jgi:hypothetical protein
LFAWQVPDDANAYSSPVALFSLLPIEQHRDCPSPLKAPYSQSTQKSKPVNPLKRIALKVPAAQGMQVTSA